MKRKRLRVDGIPNDIPAERTKDKLTIHFLRNRNGGGEVEEIEMIPGPPMHAIVTFEDDEVVERVLKVKSHILKTKDKSYSLRVSKVAEKLELDEVFQKSSLTVNYKILPDTLKHFLKNLRKTYNKVTFDFDENLKACKISGSYTEIQMLSQDIVRKLDSSHADLNKDTNAEITDIQPNTKQSDLPYVPQIGDSTSSPYNSARQERSGATLDPELVSQEFKNKFQIGPKEDPNGAKTTLFKNHSDLPDVSHQEQFVWDSDIFKYMKQFHSLQYQEILKKYKVQVVEESSDDIAIINLQADQYYVSDLRSARSKLTQLYQSLELYLRKEQIDKRKLNGDKDLKRKLRELQTLFPKLLFHEDEHYLFLIGIGSDVALSKQRIIDAKLNLTRFQDISFTGQQPSSAASSYNLGRYESKRESRIAASFNPPIDNSSYSKTQLDEKYLTSNQPFDHDRSLSSDKTLEKTENIVVGYPSKTEDCNDEKSERKILAPIKKLNVASALKTGREDIRQSKASTKTVGPLKPVRITKASTEFPCSSLVDVGPTSLDFKLPEHKLRRSNSLPRFYSYENSSSEHHNELFKDDILIEDWVWHYIKALYKSDVEAWCTEVLLTEEKSKEIAVLKLESVSKSKLWKTKQSIQERYQEIRITITRSSLPYSDLGVKNSNDPAIDKCCRILREHSNKLCIMLKKDSLLVIYPVTIKQTIASLLERITTCTDNFSVTDSKPNNSLLSSVISTNQQDDKPANAGGIKSENYVKPLENDLSGQEDFTTEVVKGKMFTDMGTSLVGSIGNRMDQDKPFFSSLVPSLQENIEATPQLREPQDYLKRLFEKKFFEEPDYVKSKGPSCEKLHADIFTSGYPLQDLKAELTIKDHDPLSDNFYLSQNVNSLPPNLNVGDKTYQGQEKSEDILKENQFEKLNLFELRSPAVGQESEKFDAICGNCSSNRKVNKLSCGHLVCDNCHSASIESCCVSCDNIVHGERNPLKATMTYKTMSLVLQGYERSTTLKIKYEVPDGVQGVEDPNPGKPYKGGTFDAYLPDNPEGKKLLALYEKALKQGLTFCIRQIETGDIVAWHRVPHKTSPDGGKAKNGYPDSTYIRSTVARLKEMGIE